MDGDMFESFQTFSPYIINIVHRISTPKWYLTASTMKSFNLALIYDGETTFYFDSFPYKLSKGSLVFSKPGMLRQAENNPVNPARLFAVDFLYSCPVYKGGEWIVTYPELPFAPHEKINDDFLLKNLCSNYSELSKTWISNSPDKVLKCNLILGRLINTLLIKHHGGSTAYDRVRKVNRIIEFMTEHYPQNLPLETIAEWVKISPSYLCSIFKEVTGTSPTDYLINIRINKAKDLLSDGMTVTEVSKWVGFNDVYYFSKCFKKHTGFTPSQYKFLNS